MKLVVGLGNPGPEYRETRHNLGFKVLDALAREAEIITWNEKFEGLEAKTRFGVESVVLVKPITFMNLSGQAVQKFSAFYKIETSDLLVIVDDVALPLGRLKLKGKGSAGGHNGLKSVIQCLGTIDFPRLRIGVGRGEQGDLSNHVLGRFRPDEFQIVLAAVMRAAEASKKFISHGIQQAMNEFNASEKQDPDPAE